MNTIRRRSAIIKQRTHDVCLFCDSPISGRADKKFCDNDCRNDYNNKLYSAANNLVRSVNITLGKNRRILEGCLQEDQTSIKVSVELLRQKGYNFKYRTHQHTGNNGKTYGRSHQMMRISERLGLYDYTKLDMTADVR